MDLCKTQTSALGSPLGTPYGASLMAVIPAKAGIQYYEFSGFRIKCGMTIPQIISDRTPDTF